MGVDSLVIDMEVQPLVTHSAAWPLEAGCIYAMSPVCIYCPDRSYENIICGFNHKV